MSTVKFDSFSFWNRFALEIDAECNSRFFFFFSDVGTVVRVFFFCTLTRNDMHYGTPLWSWPAASKSLRKSMQNVTAVTSFKPRTRDVNSPPAR